MDIPSVDADVIAAQKLDAVAPVNTNSVTPAVTVTVTDAGASASIVEFSPLAHLLAVTVLFQAPQAGQTQTGTGAPTAGSTILSFQQLVQAASNFVDAFNSFQNTINASNATPFESAFDSALLTALQNQNIQSGSASVQSFIDSMAQLGIKFQGITDRINPNQFQLNQTALQAAYNSNATQTATLLTNAFQALSSIEQQLLTTQAAQTLDASLMTTQLASGVRAANMAATNTNGANGTNGATGSVTPNAVAVATVPAPATTQAAGAASNAATVATAMAATARAAAVTPPAAVAATLATVAATMNPATLDPIVALAVAAYRVTESMEHTPASQPANPVNEVIPDVTKTGRVEPIGPDTRQTRTPSESAGPGH